MIAGITPRTIIPPNVNEIAAKDITTAKQKPFKHIPFSIKNGQIASKNGVIIVARIDFPCHIVPNILIVKENLE